MAKGRIIKLVALVFMTISFPVLTRHESNAGHADLSTPIALPFGNGVDLETLKMEFEPISRWFSPRVACELCSQIANVG